MKKSLNFSFNLPEYEDAIDIEKLTENFSSIDTALMATRVKKTKKANSIEVSAVQPYAVIKNNNEVTITYTDLFDKEWTLEAGKSRKFAIESNSLNNFKVQVKDGLEADFEWFIDVDTAIKEGGGGGGGTSNYNDLENLPKINGVELTGNKSLDNIGAIAADSKGAANGVASLGADGKVPTSQLPDIEQKEYKLAETTSEGYAKGYKLQYKSGSTWVDVSDSAAINIPKDMVVESGSVKECSADNVPVSGYKKGDKYIDLVIANKTDAHIYINVKDLVDNKASGISYSNTDSELDATTVQSAVDEIAEIIAGKEDTANRITAWQSTPDNTHYPSEKLVKDSLDKKVNETSVSLSKEGGETTSVINVTDAKAQMAMVAKISGKTRRTVNLTDLEDRLIKAGYTKNSSGYYTDTNSSMYSKVGNIDINTQPYAASRVYTLSAIAYYDGDNGGNTRFDVTYTDNSTQSIYLFSASSGVKRIYAKTSGKTVKSIALTYGTGGVKVYIKEIQLTLGGEELPYEPYGQLWSAPVESVVSQGRNLFEQNNWITRLSTSKVSIDGEYFSISKTDGGTTEYICKSFYVPVSGNYLLKCDEVVNTSATLSSVGYSITDAPLTTYASATATFTMQGNQSNSVAVTAGKYINIIFTLISNKTGVLKYKNMRLIKSEYASEPFIPYNKTTVLVPSAVKNLPDYGCSAGNVANEIDFENGVYYHRVASVDLGSLSWIYKTEYDKPLFTAPVNNSRRNTNYECAIYTATTDYNSFVNASNDMEIYCDEGARIKITNSKYTDADAFKNGMKGVILNYELTDSAKEIKSLTDYIRPLPVEAGGTLTLVNEHNLDINSVIKYKKEVN